MKPHHWMLGDETKDGTPAICIKCSARTVFPAVKLTEAQGRRIEMFTPYKVRGKFIEENDPCFENGVKILEEMR